MITSSRLPCQSTHLASAVGCLHCNCCLLQRQIGTYCNSSSLARISHICHGTSLRDRLGPHSTSMRHRRSVWPRTRGAATSDISCIRVETKYDLYCIYIRVHRLTKK